MPLDRKKFATSKRHRINVNDAQYIHPANDRQIKLV